MKHQNKTNEKKIKIVLADDHNIVLDGLKSLIRETPDIEVIGAAHNGNEALQIISLNRSEIDIAVLDIEMPVMDGLETTRRILADFPKIKVLILTMHEKDSFIQEIVKAGASGYILKDHSSNELVNALRTIDAGQDYFSNRVKDVIFKSLQNKEKSNQEIKLTKREKEVLRLIGRSFSSKEMASELNVAPSTIETHVRNLFDKLGAKNRMDLVRYAINNGYLDNDAFSHS